MYLFSVTPISSLLYTNIRENSISIVLIIKISKKHFFDNSKDTRLAKEIFISYIIKSSQNTIDERWLTYGRKCT